MNSTPAISHDEIARRAHDLWEQCGRLEGRELEHWLQAERELRKDRAQAEQFRACLGEGPPRSSQSMSPFAETHRSLTVAAAVLQNRR